MAETTEYAPATEEEPTAEEAQESRPRKWLLIGGATAALILAAGAGAAAVAFATSSDEETVEEVTVTLRGDLDEWGVWLKEAQPLYDASRVEFDKGTEAFAAEDFEAARDHIAESAAIIARIPDSPDPFFDLKVRKTASALREVATAAAGGDRDEVIEKSMELDRHSEELRGFFS